MKVRNAINTGVVPIPSKASLLEAVEQMDRHGVRVLVVLSELGDPAGILTDREITEKAEASNPMFTPVKEAMCTEIVGCFEDVELEDALQIMLLKRIQHMPVFDRESHLVGFVSAQPRTHDIH